MIRSNTAWKSLPATVVVLFLLAAGPSTAHAVTLGASEIHRRFANGNQYYQAGEYDKAETEYRTLIDAGVRDPILFCNLGNTYVQLGQKGRAVAMYERTLRLAPRDEQARKNLEYIRGGKPPQPFVLWSPFLFVRDLFSLNEWLLILEGGICAVAVAMSLLLLLRRGRARQAAWFCFIGALAFTVIVACFAPWRWHEQRGRSVGVVIEKKLVSRHGPTKSHAEHLSLAEGARVEIMGREGDGWLRVRPLDVPRDSRQPTYVPADSILRV